jgi:hypothetical protein
VIRFGIVALLLVLVGRRIEVSLLAEGSYVVLLFSVCWLFLGCVGWGVVVGSILGIVLGKISRRRIRRSGNFFLGRC